MSKKNRLAGRPKKYYSPMKFRDFTATLDNITQDKNRGRSRRTVTEIDGFAALLCKGCKQYKLTNEFHPIDVNRLYFNSYCKDCIEKQRQMETPIKLRAQQLVARAKNEGIPYEMDMENALWELWAPYSDGKAKCPYRRVALYLDDKFHHGDANAWTIDKIIPEKGYVRGNMEIVSFLANISKQNMTKRQFWNMCGEIYQNLFDTMAKRLN